MLPVPGASWTPVTPLGVLLPAQLAWGHAGPPCRCGSSHHSNQRAAARAETAGTLGTVAGKRASPQHRWVSWLPWRQGARPPATAATPCPWLSRGGCGPALGAGASRKAPFPLCPAGFALRGARTMQGSCLRGERGQAPGQRGPRCEISRSRSNSKGGEAPGRCTLSVAPQPVLGGSAPLWFHQSEDTPDGPGSSREGLKDKGTHRSQGHTGIVGTRPAVSSGADPIPAYRTASEDESLHVPVPRPGTPNPWKHRCPPALPSRCHGARSHSTLAMAAAGALGTPCSKKTRRERSCLRLPCLRPRPQPGGKGNDQELAV